MEVDSSAPVDDQPKQCCLSCKRLCLIPAILLVIILLGGGIYLMKLRAPISSEPYKMALQRVQQDRQVLKLLGEPIEDVTRFPTGSVHVEGDRGEANLGFDVAGPKGKAHVSTRAGRIDGKWGLTTVEVTIAADGQRLLLDRGDKDGKNDDRGEAPRWPP